MVLARLQDHQRQLEFLRLDRVDSVTIAYRIIASRLCSRKKRHLSRTAREQNRNEMNCGADAVTQGTDRAMWILGA